MRAGRNGRENYVVDDKMLGGHALIAYPEHWGSSGFMKARSVIYAADEAMPPDRAGLIEHYILSDRDLSLIRCRRGAQNRLGLAVQLAFGQSGDQSSNLPGLENRNIDGRVLRVRPSG